MTTEKIRQGVRDKEISIRYIIVAAIFWIITVSWIVMIFHLAHTMEFALLTIFSYVALSSTNKISNKTSYAESPVKLMRSDNEMNIVFTLWFAILNAIFDEYHQLFVDGRDGSIKDVHRSHRYYHCPYHHPCRIHDLPEVEG